MTLPVFPTGIEDPEYPLGVSTIGGTVRSNFEGGYVNTRARFTRLRKKWSLSWSMMSAADYATLQTFFEETVVAGSGSFTWSHPISGSYTVRFAEDELNFNLSTPGVSGFYDGSVTLEEV